MIWFKPQVGSYCSLPLLANANLGQLQVQLKCLGICHSSEFQIPGFGLTQPQLLQVFAEGTKGIKTSTSPTPQSFPP